MKRESTIPINWQLLKLDDLGDWKGGGTPSKANISFWENGTIPWASSQDIKNSVLHKTTHLITDEGLRKSASNLIPKNNLLMVTRSGILQHTFPVVKNKIDVAINQDIKAILISSFHNTDFIQAILLLRNKHILKTCSKTGTTVESIEYDWLKTYKIPVPPLPEQKAIAKILSTWDTAIEKLTLLIKQKELKKKALMQQLLTGKRRFKELKGEWKEVHLSNLFKRITRKNNEGNDNVVTMSAQRGLIRQDSFFKKNIASEILDNYYLLKKEEFAYNKSYSNGYPMGAIKRLKLYDKAVVTTLYICFDVKDPAKTSRDYFEHFFEAGYLNRGLTKIAHEGGRAHGLLNVTPGDFFNLKIQVPSYDEQKKIAIVINAAEKELQLLKKKLDALKEQKKCLMQQLLTGKKRVKI